MPTDLSKIRNIVVVMAENRSFDHMLGYLSLPPSNRHDVDGLRVDQDWAARFSNYDQGQVYAPFLGEDPYTMPNEFDPPHESSNVAGHLGPLQNDIYPMNGFVSAIPASVSSDPAVRKLVMSYFTPAQAPMNDFFARNYAICDRWFSSLPAGTQPNRLISMSGYSRIDVNHDILPDHHLVYDWLTDHGVSWRVYHQGVPFFIMMPKWLPEILLSDRFRSFSDLEGDLVSTPPDQFPQVIFVEPTNQDAPHLSWSTDEHAPSGISNGQEFLMEVYNAVTNSRAFWRGAVMIVDYDEHGGFFDHVSPPMIRTEVPANATYNTPFVSLGVRIPNYVISPFVQAGFVHHTLLDHTSVLKLIGEKFGTNGSYSTLVDARPVERRELLAKIGGAVVTKSVEEIKEEGNTVLEDKQVVEGGVLAWGQEDELSMEELRRAITSFYGDETPTVLDPFAGGGAIPLEAMRLGCAVTASDLNPVAWFILKCTLDYPQQFAGRTWPLPSFVRDWPDFVEDFLAGKIKKRRGEKKSHFSDPKQLALMEFPDADLAWHVRAWGRWVGMMIRNDHADHQFEWLRKEAGVLRFDSARYQPRLHDFRHSFAVTRLLTWYRQGKDVQRMLPLLSTYLGHCGVEETSVYLQMTRELLQEANRCFERYAFTEVHNG